jgi:hypothetical protein
MLEIMLNINSEDYDYNMINHVYKTLSEKIADVKLDFERSKFDKSKIFEGSFILKSNSDVVVIDTMIFLHLLVMSYLVGFEVSEDQEMYKNILNGSIAENIEQYEDELKKADTLYFENENRKKVYNIFIELFRISENVFISLVNNIKGNIREKILTEVILKFNSSNRIFNSIFREKIKIDKKLDKCFNEIEKIFEKKIIPICKEYLSDEADSTYHLIKILEDGIKAIYTSIIFEKEGISESLNLIYNKNTWFVYFYSVLFSNYNKSKINLLKLNGNIDFLKFGADISTVNRAIDDFIIENKLQDIDKELEAEIFYIFLSTGYYNKSLYNIKSLDESYKIELNFIDKNRNKIFDKGLEVYRLNRDLVLLNFINMILMTENNNLKESIETFYEKINDIQIDEEIEEEIKDVEFAINDIFRNLEEGMFLKYNELKKIYYSEIKENKIRMIKEFINILMNRTNVKVNSKKNMVKNYEIALENLKNKINCEINVVKDVNLPNHLIITHNLTDFPRLENERKFLDESNEEYREKSKIIIKVTMNSDMEEDENVNLIINMKIFFLLAVYSGIRNDIYFMNLNKNLKELYFGVVTDIHYMLNLKENFLLQDLSFIQENDYFEHLIEKTENYFLSLSLNKREDIKKINLGTVKEPQEYLDTFKNALIDGYFYYKNNYDKYIEDSAINKDLNDIINILTENFDLDEVFI